MKENTIVFYTIVDIGIFFSGYIPLVLLQINLQQMYYTIQTVRRKVKLDLSKHNTRTLNTFGLGVEGIL